MQTVVWLRRTFLASAVLFIASMNLVFGPPSALAQESASVSGRVTDETASAVPGAEVEIKDVDTGFSQTTKTNGEGFYSFSGLKPGRYQMTVRKQSFESVSVTGIILNVQEKVSHSFLLKVGSVAETVTVTAETNHVNTTDATVSTVIEREMVENLPLNGRSFQSLLELTPGVSAVSATSATGNLADQGQFVVNGQRTSSNYFTVDGVSANTGATQNSTLGQAGTGSLPGQTALGGFNGLVSIDALQEFRIQTSTYAPEYGRSTGGQVALVTRSGTNHYHGDAFDYFRNTVLDANDWFLNAAGKPRGTERQNDFGGVFGGPVVNDKLFFFLSYEGMRLTNPKPGQQTVPTYNARIYALNASNGAGSTGYMAQFLNAYPCPNNTSGVNCASGPQPTGLGTTACAPMPGPGQPPNPGSDVPCLGTFTNAFPQNSQLDSGSVRIDYVPNSKIIFFGRYVHSPSSTVAVGSGLALSSGSTIQGSDTGTLAFTYILSPTVTNDLRFNYSRTTAFGSDTPPAAFKGSLSGILPAGFAQPSPVLPLSQISLSFQPLGFAGPGLNIDQAGLNSATGQFNIVDSLSVVKGAHTLKFGVDFRLTDPNIHFAPYSFDANFGASGPVMFGGGGGASPGPCSSTDARGSATQLPAYICGLASSIFVQNNYLQNYRFQNWSLFAQDTWKATPRLTLTYGVRYEVDPAPSSTNGRPFFSLNNFDPAQCGIHGQQPQANGTFCNAGLNPIGTASYATTWGNFAPRIGIAYQLSQDPKWQRVVRGGFGIFHDTAADASSATSGPYSEAISAYPTSPFPPPPPVQFPISTNAMCGNILCSQYLALPSAQIPSPTNPTMNAITAAAPNLKLPYVYQFNVAFQQALGSRQSATVTYVGAVGRNLIGPVFELGPATALVNGQQVNVPISPTFGGYLVVFGNYATSDYHALQTQFQRQFTHGLGFTVAYTWSHSIDDASNFNEGVTYPLSLSRSSSDFDIRQTLAASLVYDIPAPFKKNRFASAVLGHWSAAPIYHFQTALPVNVIAVNTVIPGIGAPAQRPNLIPGVPIYVYGSQCVEENLAAAGVSACPGGRAVNSATIIPFGPMAGQCTLPGLCATPTQMANARCNPMIEPVGPFCQIPLSVNGSFNQQGDVGRNFLRGYHLQELDVDFSRVFPIHEGVKLRFEGDFFNIFNHPNFAAPGANMQQALRFGVPGSMENGALGTPGSFNPLYTLGGPRSVQLALKILF